MTSDTPNTPATYGRPWFESLGRYRKWNRQAMHAILAHLGEPDTVLDVGCGDTAMLGVAYDLGASCVGVEIAGDAHVHPKSGIKLIQHDLAKPLDLKRQFGLVLCIEVGEHMEEAAADTLCATLAKHTAQWLVFTAAAPGQNGEGHVNCQPQEYWRAKLEGRGTEHGALQYNGSMTEHLYETWRWTTGPMFWLPQNLQVFEFNRLKSLV